MVCVYVCVVVVKLGTQEVLKFEFFARPVNYKSLGARSRWLWNILLYMTHTAVARFTRVSSVQEGRGGVINTLGTRSTFSPWSRKSRLQTRF